MPLQVQVEEGETQHLSEHAKEELAIVTNNYVRDLLKEASRLEAANRTHKNDPEVTREMIKDASIFLKRYPVKRQRPWWYIGVQICTAITALITGIMYDSTALQNNTYMIWFVIVLSLAILFTILQIMLGRSE